MHWSAAGDIEPLIVSVSGAAAGEPVRVRPTAAGGPCGTAGPADCEGCPSAQSQRQVTAGHSGGHYYYKNLVRRSLQLQGLSPAALQLQGLSPAANYKKLSPAAITITKTLSGGQLERLSPAAIAITRTYPDGHCNYKNLHRRSSLLQELSTLPLLLQELSPTAITITRT